MVNFSKNYTFVNFFKLKYLDHATDLLAQNLDDELIINLLEWSYKKWFEDNYQGRIYRNGRKRRSVRFPPELRNMYEKVLNSENRTNNHAEATNRRLNIEIGVCNPTLRTFIVSYIVWEVFK